MKQSKLPMLKKTLSISLALALFLTTVGCNQTNPSAGSNKQYPDEITYNDYEANQNVQGMQTGWFAKIIKEKFNIKLNTIAPNVSGQATFQTRSAAGNLGDIVTINKGDLQNVVNAGLLMDMTPMMKDHGSTLSKYTTAINSVKTSLNTDKIFAIPNSISSTLSPTAALPFVYGATVQTQSGAAPYLRWDLYQAIGSPKMNTIDDLLPVLKNMQAIDPKSDSGKKTYPFSFFKDWDSFTMQNVSNSIPQMYGYNMVPGTSTILTNGDSSKLEVQRIDDENGLYYKTLKLYYEANKMGLVDPDSPSQTWNTLTAKTNDGQVLYSNYGWSSIQRYNTPALGNSVKPKGFEFVPIADQKYFDTGYNPYGQEGSVTGIGSKAKDPERLMDFLNWLAEPSTELMLANGPKGLTWNVKDGQPVLTAFGVKALQDGSIEVPASYGGGTYTTGCPATIRMLNQFEIDPTLKTTYLYELWPSVLKSATTKLDESWQSATDSKNMIDYAQKHNMLVVSPGNSYVAPQDAMEIKNNRLICGKIVIDASWQMVFASSDAQFNSLWTKMKSQLDGNGWKDIVAADMKTAKAYNAACQKSIKEAKSQK